MQSEIKQTARGRAWRRSQQHKPSHQASVAYRKETSERRCLEKDWSMMCRRGEKCRRAKQLAKPYPSRRQDEWVEWFE